MFELFMNNHKFLIMLFSTGTMLKCAGVVGPKLGLQLDWSASSSAALLCKDKREEGSVRASPVAAPMPKSVPRSEKRWTA